MPSIAGRKCTISVSTDSGSTYHVMLGIATISGGGPTAAPIDDAEFGIAWMQKITGILDNKISLKGGFRGADSTGQIAIRTAQVAGNTVFIKVLFDGTTYGWTQEMMCSKFAPNGDVKARIDVDIDMEGTGPMTFLP
jgi:predicted secreted protein